MTLAVSAVSRDLYWVKPMSPKLIGAALLLFLMPIGVVVMINADEIREGFHIEASESRGKVLFFTAPNR